MRATETMNEDTLNEKIAAIDYKLTTSSMSLKEEKGLLMEMKKLKVLFSRYRVFPLIFCNI